MPSKWKWTSLDSQLTAAPYSRNANWYGDVIQKNKPRIYSHQGYGKRSSIYLQNVVTKDKTRDKKETSKLNPSFSIRRTSVVRWNAPRGVVYLDVVLAAPEAGVWRCCGHLSASGQWLDQVAVTWGDYIWVREASGCTWGARVYSRCQGVHLLYTLAPHVQGVQKVL